MRERHGGQQSVGLRLQPREPHRAGGAGGKGLGFRV